MKKTFKRIMSMFLAVVIVLAAAPLAGFVGLELPDFEKIFAVKANAATSDICGKNLTDVCSTGTETQVKAISIGSNNACHTKATIRYNNDKFDDNLKIIDSGNYGPNVSTDYSIVYDDNIKWILYNDGELVISGSGKMYNCPDAEGIWPPWVERFDGRVSKNFIGEYDSFSRVKSVIIEDGVTSIGDRAFYWFSNITKIKILSSQLSRIGDYAFYDCSNLTDVYYTGTEAQWKAISIGSDNKYLTNATIHYNYVPGSDEEAPPTEGNVHNQNIKVMSYNVYSENKNDYAYSNRAKYIAQNIMDNSPDSVGLQEVTGDFFKLIYGDDVADNDSLGQTELGKKYGFVGEFRNGGKYLNGKAVATKNDGGNNEACLILYDKTKYDLIESDTFWLSEDPDEISFGWIKENKNYRRICTYALLKNKTTGNVYVHFNTHISHDDTNALKSMQLITEYIEKKFAGIPVVLTGDFNHQEPNNDNICQNWEAPYYVLTDNKYKNVKNQVSQSDGTITYHDYGRGETPKIIDFIFINEYASAVSYDVYDKDYSNNGLKIKYASDHHPVVAELRVTYFGNDILIPKVIEVKEGTNRLVKLKFRQDWFKNDSLIYNHNLAQLCSQFVTLGYNYKALKNGLISLGFKNDEIFWENKSEKDKVDNFIANRDITVNGETYTLLFVGCIGTNSVQWYSNFEPGIGETHESFNAAKNYVYDNIQQYILDNAIDTSKIKILLCGHSRGAATANLLAAELIDEQAFATEENIYTYTFATPNPTSSKKVTDKKYDRIFNFVNPEDFVTKVLPAQWGYGRYGKTYTLPSKENSYAYNTLKKNMQAEYDVIMNNQKYHPYPGGEAQTYKVVNELTSVVKNIKQLFEEKFLWLGKMKSIQQFFIETVCKYMANNDEKTEAEKAQKKEAEDSLKATSLWKRLGSCLTILALSDYFVFYQGVGGATNGLLMDDYFTEAHQAETYCAYMMSMTLSQATTYRKTYKNTVNCPVDIEVYDNATNELVGRITNNVIDSNIAAKENAIVMDVDGDSKSFWLPSNGDYRVVLVGNDEGTMDYTVSDIDSDTGETIRANFFDIEIENDVSMTGKFISNNTTVENYTLVHEENGTIKPTEIIGKEQLQKFIIITSAEGNGIADGEFAATSGDYVTVSAYPSDGGYFTGWYENGKLVSTDVNYSFVVKKNRSLVAKFESFNIRIPSNNTIKYGDSIILHADMKSELLAGYYIEWTTDNANFTIVETSDDGKTCTITPSVSGETTFTATVYDADGNAVGTDTQTMTAKAGFFQKIIAFFKKLFGLTKIIPEAFRTEVQ